LRLSKYKFFLIINIFISYFICQISVNYSANAEEIVDIEKRIKELTKEAQSGNTDAQYTLGRIALEAKSPPDHSGAVYWFKIAAESNHVAAQEMLGAHLFSGIGVPPNPKEAYKWWKRAALSGSVKAQASLGVLYALGTGIEKNNIEAYKWLTIAAFYGNKNAQIQRDESIALQMTADEIREAQNRIEETLRLIKK